MNRYCSRFAESCFNVIQVIGDAVQQQGGYFNVFSESAIQKVSRRSLGSAGEGVPCQALPATTTGVGVLLGNHSVNRRPAAYPCSDGDDFSRKFVTNDYRRGIGMLVVLDFQITSADAASTHANQHLVGGDLWDGYILQLHVTRTGGNLDQRLHRHFLNIKTCSWVHHDADRTFAPLAENIPGATELTQRQVMGDQRSDIHQALMHQVVPAFRYPPRVRDRK